MARPTINPRGTNLAGAYIDGQIRGPALGTNSVGLTQVPTVLERSISIGSAPRLRVQRLQQCILTPALYRITLPTRLTFGPFE